MKQGLFAIAENKALNASVFRMRLEGDASAVSRPGQFIDIKLPGRYLRRPISVCEYDDSSITILYKVLGHGTEDMTRLPVGTVLDILTGLGNGFDAALSGDSPLLIGGGIGTPPLYALAKELCGAGKKVTAVLGFNTAAEIFYTDEFRRLGVDVILATADGSAGVRGFVTDVVRNVSCSYYYACGPLPMLKAVWNTADSDGELSFEERMGCGFGACMGCTCRTTGGAKRVCRDGPVLRKGEILWED